MLKITINDKQEQDIKFHEEAVEINGHGYKPDLVKITDTQYHLLLNNKSYSLTIKGRESNKKMVVEVNGNAYTVDIKDQYDLLLHDLGMDAALAAQAEDVKAPMPGLVIDILVQPGEQVVKGTPLLVLEAMKMENVLKAASDGVIGQVSVKPKDAVEKNQVLITFK